MAVYLSLPILDEVVRLVENDSICKDSLESIVTIVEATRTGDSLQSSLEQLEDTLNHANTELGRCWAIIIHGVNFKFYEYHRNPSAQTCLVPWGPPGQQHQNSFHVRDGSAEIDWMLRHMAQNSTPLARSTETSG